MIPISYQLVGGAYLQEQVGPGAGFGGLVWLADPLLVKHIIHPRAHSRFEEEEGRRHKAVGWPVD